MKHKKQTTLWQLMIICALMGLFSMVQATTFTNTLNTQNGADPWMTYYDGYYYLASTTWTSKIYMKRAQTVEGLKTATPVEIWDGAKDDPSRCCNMWAFEFRLLDGPNGKRWYFHYTAGVSENLDGQRMYVLESSGQDPMGPYTYKAKLKDSNDGWAIDGSYLTLNDRLYWLFSAWDGAYQKIYIAPMSNPWTISGNRVLLSMPEYNWEKQENNVNEGPVALQHDGNTFITYSASFCDGPNYKLGLLTYNGGDPLKTSSWNKSREPVFQRSDENGVYGPGHNGFFTSPDGTEHWIVYHAQSDVNKGCDSNRTTRIQKFTWNKDGTPNFGLPLPVTAQIQVPSGESGDQGFVGSRFESYNYPNYFIRHYDLRAKVEGNIALFADSQWVMKPGLADSNGVSFESVNFPGRYLRHDGYELVLSENDNSRQFASDATFYQRIGLADASLSSFESYNLPGYFIRHQDFLLNLTKISSATDQADATFRITGDNASGILKDGVYYIKNNNSGKCLRTLNGSNTNGAGIVQYTCGQNKYEQWQVTSIGLRQYHITQVSSGKLADITGGSTQTGVTNIIWPYNGGDNQKWQILDQGDGYYHIRNVHSNLLLDIQSHSLENNAQNIQWSANGGFNQDWEFIPVD
ncbi:family 43 glycosylhydrolase [Gynuella sp.]|uniref:family 43 glycosylhydrolase n=1 Tax=Gynuella sp. TaxID=2969146 RepID=UPI003D121C99